MTTVQGRAGLKVLRILAILFLITKPLPADVPVKDSALIQIAVEVVEVDEQKTQKLGLQWMDSVHIVESEVPALFQVGRFTRSQLFADLQAMLRDGAADLLANPKLVTREGTSATFHAGGEIPYATTSGTGGVSIEFKTYGVDLKIKPRIAKDQRIVMDVEAEVSSPDDTNGVTLSGNTVPGLRSRKVSSDLIMNPGSTLTMAGLLQNQKQWVRTGIPGLMHIPVLGYLFSAKTQRTARTSVVVFITPTFLEPTAASTALAPVHNPEKPIEPTVKDEFLQAWEDSHG